MTDSCICTSLRRASRRLSAVYDTALAPAGVNVAQFSLLRNIGRHAPVSLTRLAEATELDRSTLGRNVRVLQRLGLLDIAAGRDQREATLRLTPAGTTALQQGDPLWDAAQHAIATKIGPGGIAQLEALLGAL